MATDHDKMLDELADCIGKDIAWMRTRSALYKLTAVASKLFPKSDPEVLALVEAMEEAATHLDKAADLLDPDGENGLRKRLEKRKGSEEMSDEEYRIVDE